MRCLYCETDNRRQLGADGRLILVTLAPDRQRRHAVQRGRTEFGMTARLITQPEIAIEAEVVKFNPKLPCEMASPPTSESSEMRRNRALLSPGRYDRTSSREVVGRSDLLSGKSNCATAAANRRQGRRAPRYFVRLSTRKQTQSP